MLTSANFPGTESFEKQAEKFSLIPLNGKIPLEAGWQKYCHTKRKSQDFDPAGNNVGVCCGPASGILVLDIDDEDAFNHLITTNGYGLPETYTVRTGGGGLHHYFKYPSDSKRYGNRSLKHPVFGGHTIFDVRGDGGYVVAPGSVHPDTGNLYVIEKDVPKADAPEWLLRYVLTGEITKDALWSYPLPPPVSEAFVRELKISDDSKDLILQGTQNGERSEAIGKVLGALNGAGYDDRLIFFIFDHYPIGEKYREKGHQKQNGFRMRSVAPENYIDEQQEELG